MAVGPKTSPHLSQACSTCTILVDRTDVTPTAEPRPPPPLRDRPHTGIACRDVVAAEDAHPQSHTCMNPPHSVEIGSDFPPSMAHVLNGAPPSPEQPPHQQVDAGKDDTFRSALHLSSTIEHPPSVPPRWPTTHTAELRLTQHRAGEAESTSPTSRPVAISPARACAVIGRRIPPPLSLPHLARIPLSISISAKPRARPNLELCCTPSTSGVDGPEPQSRRWMATRQPLPESPTLPATGGDSFHISSLRAIIANPPHYGRWSLSRTTPTI